MAGIVAAMPGGATIITPPLLGRLGDRIGTQKILIGGFFNQHRLFYSLGLCHQHMATRRAPLYHRDRRRLLVPPSTDPLNQELTDHFD